MKAEIYENGGITMDDIKRNQALTTWGLTEGDLKGQEVPQQPAPTEKGDEALTNYIPENK